MCGRFCISASPGEIGERYRLVVPREYRPCHNLAPGQMVLTITGTPEAYTAHMNEWGLSLGVARRVINARMETILEKPLFQNSFLSNRCLIPASGYFEWKVNGNRKTPYFFSSQSDPLISFAGLIHPSPEGDQVVILTTPASLPYSGIHDRMPVILTNSDEGQYLSEGTISICNKILTMHEVSSRVNQVGPDDPALITPVKQGSVQKSLDV